MLVKIDIYNTINKHKILKDIDNFISDCHAKYELGKDFNIDIENIEEEENSTEIEESVNLNTQNDSIELQYTVPKVVAFTSRFQYRIENEVEDILNNIYPNCFKIREVVYKENNDDNMIMAIQIEANTENAIDKLKDLDKNVEYIIKDLVEYYI